MSGSSSGMTEMKEQGGGACVQRQIMENLRGKIKEVRGQFLKALPVICFFLALYYSVILLFGLNHVMVASLVTVVFQVNYRKHLSVRALLRLAVQ